LTVSASSALFGNKDYTRTHAHHPRTHTRTKSRTTRLRAVLLVGAECALSADSRWRAHECDHGAEACAQRRPRHGCQVAFAQLPVVSVFVLTPFSPLSSPLSLSSLLSLLPCSSKLQPQQQQSDKVPNNTPVPIINSPTQPPPLELVTPSDGSVGPLEHTLIATLLLSTNAHHDHSHGHYSTNTLPTTHHPPTHPPTHHHHLPHHLPHNPHTTHRIPRTDPRAPT
jgi:hypothetical protein